MQDFRKLDVWLRSHKLVLDLYKSSQRFPKEEVFGVTMQLRRGAMGIPTRLATASARTNPAEKAADINKAIAFASELEYTIFLANDLGYLDGNEFERLAGEAVEIRKMLFGLLRTL